MNDGLDEGAAERIEKEQVFLIKPSLSSLARSQRFKTSRCCKQRKAGQEHQMERGPVLSRPCAQIGGEPASRGVMTHVFVALICLRSRALSADSHPIKGHVHRLLSFFSSFCSFDSFYCCLLLFNAATPMCRVASVLADTGVMLLR